MKGDRGFSIAEIAIVVAVVGVLLAAVFLLFGSGSDAARRVSESSGAETDARLGANDLESFLQTVGYTAVPPQGEWHPVALAEADMLVFVANQSSPSLFGPEDTLCLDCTGPGFTVTDASGALRHTGGQGASIELAYYDGTGSQLGADLLSSQSGRDMIRRIDFRVTSGSGEPFTVSGSCAPPNLAFSGQGGLLRMREMSGGRSLHYFDESFENSSTLFNQDYIEAVIGWDPIRWEDFESSSSWLNRWYTNTSDASGRARRYDAEPSPYEGDWVLALDRSGPGGPTLSAAVWNVDLAGYNVATDELRLHYFWKEYHESVHPEDGVFFPTYIDEDDTPIFVETFDTFALGSTTDGWTYWTDTYGNILVTSLYPMAGNGKYINLDSRVSGSQSRNRIMWTVDMSAHAAAADLYLKFYACSRGEEFSGGSDGDMVGLVGSGGITSTPVWYSNLVLPVPGAWTEYSYDLDAVVPPGYDWSNFSILLAQTDNDRTTSMTGIDGLSFDSIMVSTHVSADTLFEDKIASTPSPWAAGWNEAFVDLDDQAAFFGRSFANPFPIAFVEYGDNSIPDDGILVDWVTIEQSGRWIIPGWTHAPAPGYTVDQWYPSQHMAYWGTWCWAVNGAGSYTATPTVAYIQSPLYDLSSYAPGTRLSFAFFHTYTWYGNSDGCNVKIWNDTTHSWDLMVPYWGYYTAAVPALGGEPGWTGTTGATWNFCVFDITEYAGKSVRLRFYYGTQGAGSADGWNVDYTRFRVGPDWPQVIWYGWPQQIYADWFAWSTPPGVGDPGAAAYGTRSAGNDMSITSPWNTYYENSTHNALISPPVTFDDVATTDPYMYISFMNCCRSQPTADLCLFEGAPFATTVADTAWRVLGSWTGSSGSWWKTRIYMNPHFNYWHSLGQCLDNTVVFRWRMYADAATSSYGGWNVDSIKCFSSASYLAPLTAPPLADNGGPEPVLYIDPAEYGHHLPTDGNIVYMPVLCEDDRQLAPLQSR